MATTHFDSSSELNETSSRAKRLKVPRLVSLEHRLERAKDADGKPFPLADELMFVLEEPLADTTDRWQAGADLCARYKIQTSRMAVWRYYRANILQWRRNQAPVPPVEEIDREEISKLRSQARLLAARRVLEMLNDPKLTPGQLIGLLQIENQRHQLALDRAEFQERVGIRCRREDRELLERREKVNLAGVRFPYSPQNSFTASGPVPPHPAQ